MGAASKPQRLPRHLTGRPVAVGIEVAVRAVPGQTYVRLVVAGPHLSASRLPRLGYAVLTPLVERVAVGLRLRHRRPEPAAGRRAYRREGEESCDEHRDDSLVHRRPPGSTFTGECRPKTETSQTRVHARRSRAASIQWALPEDARGRLRSSSHASGKPSRGLRSLALGTSDAEERTSTVVLWTAPREHPDGRRALLEDRQVHQAGRSQGSLLARLRAGVTPPAR